MSELDVSGEDDEPQLLMLNDDLKGEIIKYLDMESILNLRLSSKIMASDIARIAPYSLGFGFAPGAARRKTGFGMMRRKTAAWTLADLRYTAYIEHWDELTVSCASGDWLAVHCAVETGAAARAIAADDDPAKMGLIHAAVSFGQSDILRTLLALETVDANVLVRIFTLPAHPSNPEPALLRPGT